MVKYHSSYVTSLFTITEVLDGNRSKLSLFMSLKLMAFFLKMSLKTYRDLFL